VRARKPYLFAATLGIAVAFAAVVVPATAASAGASADDAVVTLNDGGSIGTIDTTSGVTSVFSGPSHSGLFGDAFSTDGNLYGLENGQFVQIDQTTGATTAIGSNQNLFYGLDQAPDGTMYADSYGGPDGSGLYEIDTATGAVTFVGSNPGAMDVTFDCSGTLWGTDSGQLYSYDLATGATTNTVTLTGSADASMIMSLFVDAAGDMLATTYSSPAELFNVDPSTGALTLLGSNSGAYPHGGDDANACSGVAQPTTVGSVAGTSTFGQTATLTATLTAFGSGIPAESVGFSVNGTTVGTATTDSNGVATLDGVDTTGIDAGSYTGAVAATFTGDASYTTSSGSGDLTVTPAAQAVSFTTTPATETVGDSYAAAATGGQSGQAVVFSADASTTNSACTVAADGTVTFQHTGVCVIDADQAGNVDYTAAPTAQQTVAVGAAATTLTVAVGPNAITATVTPANLAAGTPTGTVQFSVNGDVVGTALLNSSGIATLAYTVPTDAVGHVAAAYLGGADFTGSAGSTSRSDPTITTTVTSTRPMTHRGWYSGPVTVRFACADGSAQLTSPCPAKVTLTRSGGGQSVTRIVTATDGGAAAATVTGINIDRTPPRVHVTGARNGGVYRGTPRHLVCVAADALSGVARCIVRTSPGHDGLTRYTATATNGAGRSATIHGSYRVFGIWLRSTPWRNGKFDVRAGSTVTVRVASHTRPRYEWAAPATTAASATTPHGGDIAFRPMGSGEWRLRITLSKAMTRRYSQWNLGVRVGTTLHVIRIAFRH
jgi:Bacterial Ig-like domain (group 3)